MASAPAPSPSSDRVSILLVPPKRHLVTLTASLSLRSQVRTMGPLGSSDAAGSEERVNMFMELVDGVFLHKIMTQM